MTIPMKLNHDKDLSKRHKWTIEDVAKVIFIVSILAAIPLAIYCASDDENDRTSAPMEKPYVNYSVEQSKPGSKHQKIQYPTDTKENRLIKELDKGDYYDYSDYYDGLDGERSDIDYSEVRDYFED